jgi:hypothetical protein
LLNQWTCDGCSEVVKLILQHEWVVNCLLLELVKLWRLIESNLADLVVHRSLELCLSDILWCRWCWGLYEEGY